MKVLKKRCVLKLAEYGIFSTSGLLVAQDLWLLKDARKSVKAKNAVFGPLHLATTGAKVARMRQAWIQAMAAVMEIE